MRKLNLLLHLLLPMVVIMVLVDFGGQTHVLRLIFKPLIMVWVALYFVVNLKDRNHPILLPAMLAFFFSWMGDIALLFSGSLFFLMGLGSFLISHLCYIWVFQRRVGLLKNTLLARRPLWILPFLLYGILLAWILLPRVNVSLKIAILFYTATILAMAVSALDRKGAVPGNSFLLVMAGALFFLFSDSAIALNKFVVKIPWSGYWVMSTYIAAQVLIMLGLLAEANHEPSNEQ
jgi:uncharacterized membrane protein YhhN